MDTRRIGPKTQARLAKLRRRGESLRRDLAALLWAYRDPRVRWYSKAIILLTLAYALSPIDLIPDFIPVVGYLDDLVLLPLGVYLSLKTIPKEVLAEYRRRASRPASDPRIRRIGLLLVLLAWATITVVVLVAALRVLHR